LLPTLCTDREFALERGAITISQLSIRSPFEATGMPQDAVIALLERRAEDEEYFDEAHSMDTECHSQIDGRL